jgi:hypothetical protein
MGLIWCAKLMAQRELYISCVREFKGFLLLAVKHHGSNLHFVSSWPINDFSRSQGHSRGSAPDCERPVLLAILATGQVLAYQAFLQPHLPSHSELLHSCAAGERGGGGGIDRPDPMDLDQVLGSPTAATAATSGQLSRLTGPTVRNYEALNGHRAFTLAFRRLEYLEFLPPHFEGPAEDGMSARTRHLPRMTRFDALTFADPVSYCMSRLVE